MASPREKLLNVEEKVDYNYARYGEDSIKKFGEICFPHL